ncbi:MAG: lipoyl synthase, partial [Victivallales bacterium]|nr:lipoyl synthase [Victivallales bacterium]
AELTQFNPEATAHLRKIFRQNSAVPPPRMPEWLHIPFVGGRERGEMRSLIVEGGLHTVCESAKCPNRCDCWKRKTATFMILGGTCTRFCRFCSVDHGKPAPPDLEEPAKIARSVTSLGLRYVVITCVTRDDLADGGASQMAASVRAVNALPGSPKVEVLCSDYGGDLGCVDTVLAARPVVYGHNLETVERLTPAIRNRADYRRSLAVLNHAAEATRGTGILVKSGIMLGLGETEAEIRQTLADLRDNGVAMVTMGQYLRPTRRNWPVSRLVTPREFGEWESIARNEFGLRAVCGPLVRSSYMAEEAYARESFSKSI